MKAHSCECKATVPYAAPEWMGGEFYFPEKLRRLNVVLCHDWLTGMRGGERVLEVLCELFPAAPIYTLIHNPSAVSATINRHPIVTSRLQRIPHIERHYRNFLPLFVPAVEGMRLPACDLVLSTSHCVAKGVKPPAGARHFCYCFTPMRYLWAFYEEYFGSNPLKRIALAPLLAALRRWDRRASRRVTRFAAISRHVQNRIRKAYERDSDVVYPPVNIAYWTPADVPTEDFDLIVSALVPYKRIDLAIRAYNRLGRKLKIVGVGGECCRLNAIAGADIELLGWQPDPIIRELYRRCAALIFPGEEDFGIVPLEAQACGKPVVAFARGGALETIQADQTGVFFAHQTEEALIAAVRACHSRPWDAETVRRHAEQFGPEAFLRGLAVSMEASLA